MDEALCPDCLKPPGDQKFCTETGLEHANTEASRLQSRRSCYSALSGSRGTDDGFEAKWTESFSLSTDLAPASQRKPKERKLHQNTKDTLSQRSGDAGGSRLRPGTANHGGSARFLSGARQRSTDSRLGAALHSPLTPGSALTPGSVSFRQHVESAESAQMQREQLGCLGKQRDELESFLGLEDAGWCEDEGSFDDDIWPAVQARKAASNLLHVLAIGKRTANGRVPHKTPLHLARRTVQACGGLAKRFEEAKEESKRLAAGGDAADPTRALPRFAGGARPFSAPVRPRPGPDGWQGRPRCAADDEARVAKTPALQAWEQRTMHAGSNAVWIKALADTQRGDLRVLTSDVNWHTILENQRIDADRLEDADEGYKEMLRDFDRYEELVNKRFDNMLKFDQLLDVKASMRIKALSRKMSARVQACTL
ncbi:hypothetical protein DIPPA_18590 [Diplonema papillatum]|nr:hypothetical protein DIPPA_18590 [Diplonema papillatum]